MIYWGKNPNNQILDHINNKLSHDITISGKLFTY